MSARLFARLLWRQARGSRARFGLLALSVALGVTSLVGVLSASDAIEAGLRLRSRELLGGDLALESRQPLPDITASLPPAQRDAPQVRTWTLSTMARSESGRTRLVELRAVDRSRGPYPLAGVLALEPARPLESLLDDSTALVAPELLGMLGLAVGDPLSIGGQTLRIAGLITAEPDPIGFSFTLGPRVLITGAALSRTSLLRFGNRVRHRTLLSLPRLSAAELVQLKQHLLDTLPGGGTQIVVETHAEAQPALRQMLTRVEHYSGLVALLSLLVASGGVGQSIAAWLRRSAPETAIYRCLGFRPRDVFLLYLSLVAASAALGSLLGVLLGAGVPALLSRYRPQLLPPELGWSLSLRASGRGMLLGIAVPVVCSLYALSAVYRAPPVAVLRSDARPLPASLRTRGLLALFCTGMLLAVCWQQSGEALIALAFTGSVATLVLLLVALSRGLTSLVRRVSRRRLPVLMWYGAAALTRPGSGVIGSVVSLGLGTLVVLSIALTNDLLDRSLASALPARAPSLFLLDIQPDQWPGVEQICRAAGASSVESAPVVMARLRSIDGRTMRELMRERPGDVNEQQRQHRVLTREQRISWARRLPHDNRVVEGALWRDPLPNELSVEQGFARELGVRIGSMLEFDVQGVPLAFKVTSLRSVQWRSFSTNFFLLAEPGALDDAPYFRIAAARVPESAEAELESTLTAAYPNVTMLRVRSLLARAQAMLGQMATAVQLLGSFAVLTGLLTLAGSVAASQLERMREVALLKTLGVTRAGVAIMFALEYLLQGWVAGTVGAAAAYGLTWLAARHSLELTERPSWQLCVLGALLTMVLSMGAGLAASLRALWVRPSRVLRSRA